MKDLESKLRQFALRAPSPDLDRRVMSAKPSTPSGPRPARRIPRWLFAAALGMAALVGLAGVVVWRTAWFATAPPAEIPWNPAPAHPANPFDFTRPSSIFPPGEMEVVVRYPKGS